MFDFADVILTSRGTSGIEFPVFGIPCIMAGDCRYSGFGSTIEPGTKTEYFQILENIDNIELLSTEEEERAKVLAYVIFKLMSVDCSLLPEQFAVGNYNEQTWREAVRLLNEVEVHEDIMYTQVKQYLDSDCKSLINFDNIGLEALSS